MPKTIKRNVEKNYRKLNDDEVAPVLQAVRENPEPIQGRVSLENSNLSSFQAKKMFTKIQQGECLAPDAGCIICGELDHKVSRPDLLYSEFLNRCKCSVCQAPWMEFTSDEKMQAVIRQAESFGIHLFP